MEKIPKLMFQLFPKKVIVFNFIPSESVIFDLDSTFENKQIDCKSSTTKRKPIDSVIFDSKNLINYSFPFGEISSLGENIGCIGMKIKVMENAQVGDESQIIFTNILDPKLDKNLQKLTQIGTLKILEKAGNLTNYSTNYSANSQNSLDNSLQDIEIPNFCSELLPFENKNEGNIQAPDVQALCMPSIPGTQTKTRYSGQSFEFRYNETTKKYDTITRQK